MRTATVSCVTGARLFMLGDTARLSPAGYKLTNSTCRRYEVIGSISLVSVIMCLLRLQQEPQQAGDLCPFGHSNVSPNWNSRSWSRPRICGQDCNYSYRSLAECIIVSYLHCPYTVQLPAPSCPLRVCPLGSWQFTPKPFTWSDSDRRSHQHHSAWWSDAVCHR